ncbi:hypothetical protein D3C80_1018460 [compost metagenome]
MRAAIRPPSPSVDESQPAANPQTANASKAKLNKYPANAMVTTNLQPRISDCLPHQGDPTKNSIEPSVNSPAQTESDSWVMLTSTGNATSRPFCPIPSSPAHNASGQLEGDVFAIGGDLGGDEICIKRKFTVNKIIRLCSIH